MFMRALVLMLTVWAVPAQANLDAVSNQDAVSGLKAALEKGSGVAVDLLGRTDGFLGNGAVKIPLPDFLKKYEKPMPTLKRTASPGSTSPKGICWPASPVLPWPPCQSSSSF